VNVYLIDSNATAVSWTAPTNASVAIKAGRRVLFACNAPESNPQTSIAWYKDGHPIQLNSALSDYENTSYTSLNEKEYNTTGYVSFMSSSFDHLRELRCDVRVKDIQRTMHGSVILDVKCEKLIINKKKKQFNRF
jgi:hypothetical protein